MNGWSNLTMATMPGSEYLMPSGIGGLSAPMAGNDFNMGGFGGLYAEPVGAGSGGGTPYNPMGKVDTDAEDYICVHVPVAPTSDNTHANLLYKEVLTFNHKEPPNSETNSEITTLVPINWLNIWLDKMWRIGFLKFESFAKAFMTKHQSCFPNVFKNTLKSNSGKSMGLINTHKMTMGSSVSNIFGGGGGGGGNMGLAYASGGNRVGLYGNDEEEGDYDDNDDDDDDEDTQIDREKLMGTFIKYLSEELPPNDIIFNSNGQLEWLGSTFSSPKQFQMIGWVNEIISGIKSTTTANISTSYVSPTHKQEEAIMGELEDALALRRELTQKEVVSGKGDPYANSSSLQDPLKQTDLEKFMTAVKNRQEKQRQMKEEVLEFFRSAVNEPHHLQFTTDPNGVEYLFRGGFFKNWGWLGVVNTMTDDTSRKHSFGQPFASFPIAKVIVERETITYNLWGGDLKTGTQLYLKLERTPLTRREEDEISKARPYTTAGNYPDQIRPGMTYLGGGGGGGGGGTTTTGNQIVSGHTLESLEGHYNYLQKVKNIRDQTKKAWKSFGSFRIIPYHNGLNPPDLSDLEYVNIFGVKERAILIPVGMVKYDTPGYEYNYSARNLALGLPNTDTKIPPSLEASKAAMIGLPKITVILRSAV